MKVKELRKALNLSRAEMAVEVGASFQSVGGWERQGKNIDDPLITKAFQSNMTKMAKRPAVIKYLESIGK